MRVSRRELLQGAASATFVLPALSAWAVGQGGQVVATPKLGKPEFSGFSQLFERGQAEWVPAKDLKWIGMPVGGLCCGQLYLGGDGSLWHWDLWAQPEGWDMMGLSGGKHYAEPMVPKSPIEFGFSIFEAGEPIPLDSKGFKNVSFRGEYPIGLVRYRQEGRDFDVDLEAFSPFIPLNEDDSSLPVTILRYTIHNRSKRGLKLAIGGALENAVGKFSGRQAEMVRTNRGVSDSNWAALVCSANKLPTPPGERREAYTFADFDSPTYDGWKVEGTAFGPGPYAAADLPERYRSANPVGARFVNTHNGHNGEDSVQADQHVGKLTSPPFKIDRKFMNFRIGGGNHPGKACINLLVDGKVVRTSTGRNTLQLRQDWFDVTELEGKTCQFEIVDQVTGGWGHISVDHIVFADEPFRDVKLEELADWGEMALVALGTGHSVVQTDRMTYAAEDTPPTARATGTETFVGGVIQGVELKPGESKTCEFAVAWYFPNYGRPSGSFAEITDIGQLKKHYAKRFSGVVDLVKYIAKNKSRLVGDTKLWVKTWYDSTLPVWFMDRTFIPIGCLATATAHRFDNGRFYGWEGVYCCPGTCQHVWNYAQSMARVFPEFERSCRSMVDFGLSWHPDGAIDYRGESGRHIAHDGLCGTIMRTYREHSMCSDNRWLKAIWPRVKTTIQRLIAEDKDRDGMLEGEQYNTLDASWFGKISWISSMYIGALRAGAAMATDMGEPGLASEWEALAGKGSKSIQDATFNGEYFAMERDPSQPRAPGHGPGCHIDQVFGDSYLHQIGLDPLLDRKAVRTALGALYKYNFNPDAGAYMKAMQDQIKGGRWYAMPGEAGLLMTSWPRGGAREAKGEGNPDWMVGYFNECMNGFEYQAAAHMIAEGYVREGFSVVRALHDRYSPSKRNPYNEIECSDHYSRSMASYGAFLTTCGFKYHGPRGHLSFAPKVSPENFRAPFTVAKGWGTFSQKVSAKTFTATVSLVHGSLSLTKLGLVMPRHAQVKVRLGGQDVEHKIEGAGEISLLFAHAINIKPGLALVVTASLA